HPLQEGADLSIVRTAAASVLERRGRSADPGLIDALLDELASRGMLVRTASEVRLASHAVVIDAQQEEYDKLIQAIRDAEPTPPTDAGRPAERAASDTREAVRPPPRPPPRPRPRGRAGARSRPPRRGRDGRRRRRGPRADRSRRSPRPAAPRSRAPTPRTR